MAVEKLSQIASAVLPPALTDKLVGVGGGTTDLLYTLAQVADAVAGPGTDPLFLTQGLSLEAINPALDSNATFRRGAQIITTYNALNSTIGFTDQDSLYVQLNFDIGYNQFGAAGGISGKYTPIALAVGAEFVGAGEKFAQQWLANHWSMGDSFLWTCQNIFAGGPIAGDEGQGYTPVMYCQQPNQIFVDTITAVHRTTYSTTVTGNVTGNYIAQDVPVASTVGATVGDWVIINQQVPTNTTRMMAMQILSINPGVSINGVVPDNALIGDTVTPALCLTTSGNANQWGEGRVIVNNSGTSYSTGTIQGPADGLAAWLGVGTSWTNTMIGGSALNIGAIYLDVDTFDGIYFASTPLRSVYQITEVAASTSLVIYSTSVAGDAAYHGKATGSGTYTYKILPAARIMLVRPVNSPSISVVCETSTHTWTVGDTVECTICPYPDVHGFDLSLGQWTTGGVRRYFMNLSNSGARQIDVGVQIGGGSSDADLANFDPFGYGVGVEMVGCQTGIQYNDPTTVSGDVVGLGPLIIIGNYGTQAITWNSFGASLSINRTNLGMDFLMGSLVGTLSAAAPATGINPDAVRPELSWSGYFQINRYIGQNATLRFDAGGGAGLNGLWDVSNDGVGLNFSRYFSPGPVLHQNFTIGATGKLTFGDFTTSDNRITLDATTNLSAARLVKFLDTAGDVVVAAANTTGGGSALLGANSPATTNTAPYTWLQMLSHDGSTVYVPAWK